MWELLGGCVPFCLMPIVGIMWGPGCLPLGTYECRKSIFGVTEFWGVVLCQIHILFLPEENGMGRGKRVEACLAPKHCQQDDPHTMVQLWGTLQAILC